MIPVCVDGFIVQIIFGENVEMQKKTIYYNIDQQEDAKSTRYTKMYVLFRKQHYNQHDIIYSFAISEKCQDRV